MIFKTVKERLTYSRKTSEMLLSRAGRQLQPHRELHVPSLASPSQTQAWDKVTEDSWGSSRCLYSCGSAVLTLPTLQSPTCPNLMSIVTQPNWGGEGGAGSMKAAATFLSLHGWNSLLQPGLSHPAVYKLWGVLQASLCLSSFGSQELANTLASSTDHLWGCLWHTEPGLPLAYTGQGFFCCPH